MEKKIVWRALGAVVAEVIYISLVALFFNSAEKIFVEKPGMLGFMMILTLFVLSAAVSGTLILGRPILLYLDGKKNEAIKLFGATLGWIFVFFVLLFVTLIILK